MRLDSVLAAVGSCLFGLLAGAPAASSIIDLEAPTATTLPVTQNPAILAASQASPETFVRSLLKIYEDNNAPLGQLSDNRAFFSAPTAALIARLENRSSEAAFDADPFCDCQDWTSLKVSSIQTTLIDPTHATVRATMSGDSELTQRYVLVRETGGWRVDDIVHPANGSMVAGLKAR